MNLKLYLLTIVVFAVGFVYMVFLSFKENTFTKNDDCIESQSVETCSDY